MHLFPCLTALPSSRLDTLEREKLLKEFRVKFPGVALSLETLPALGLLAMVQQHCKSQAWAWLPLKRILSEAAYGEMQQRKVVGKSAMAGIVAEASGLCPEEWDLDLAASPHRISLPPGQMLSPCVQVVIYAFGWNTGTASWCTMPANLEQDGGHLPPKRRKWPLACCGPRRHLSALLCPSAKATSETTGAKSSPLDTQACRHHTLRTARGMLWKKRACWGSAGLSSFVFFWGQNQFFHNVSPTFFWGMDGLAMALWGLWHSKSWGTSGGLIVGGAFRVTEETTETKLLLMTLINQKSCCVTRKRTSSKLVPGAKGFQVKVWRSFGLEWIMLDWWRTQGELKRMSWKHLNATEGGKHWGSTATTNTA